MSKAVVLHETGSPEVFRWQDWPVGDPGPGEVRLAQRAVGVNYIDTYNRRGMPHPWPVPPLPTVLGLEGVGIVEAVGAGVAEVAVGDRVAYASPPHGAYAEHRLMVADRLVKLPGAIDDVTAAGMMLKGLTAQYLLRRTYRVQPGDTIVVHAAAGGMGLILCQWARHLGATVVGTTSTAAKAEIARAHGCAHLVVHGAGDFAAVARAVTDGVGVPVVYESIGRDTFAKSLDCLRPLGVLASYGHASGAPDPVDVIELGARGSLFVTRPAIMHYMAKRADLLAAAAELFDVVASGAVKIAVNHQYPLRDAGQAHRAIEQRQTTGSTVLLPQP